MRLPKARVCVEFGIRCDINDRFKVGSRKNCVPAYDHLYSVGDYVTFFKALKDPGRVLAAAIAGPTSQVAVRRDPVNPMLDAACTSAMGIAHPAIRIKAFIDGFGADGQFSSICEADYSAALVSLGRKVVARTLGQCLASPPLTDGGRALACAAKDAIGPGAKCERSCLAEAACRVEEERQARVWRRVSARSLVILRAGEGT